MSTPDRGPSVPEPSEPYGPPPGGVPSAPGGFGTPPAYGTPASYGTPGGFGTPPAYGTPGSYGTPAPYGASGGVVGPDGTWLGPPLASWGRRLGGYLVDTLVVVAVSLVFGAVDVDLGNIANLAVLLAFGYLTGTTGQTPGRRAVGIRVLRLQDGQVLGAGAGIGRQLLHVLDALPLLLGYFWPLWDKKNQTFADKIIGSVVVRT